ncbi:MAG TPA: hypothetical protein VLZ10_07315 [Thermodesulfobacteriota bacterium]|nr:hypothetical protein [Thermodesulfobacteriota bacterium]
MLRDVNPICDREGGRQGKEQNDLRRCDAEQEKVAKPSPGYPRDARPHPGHPTTRQRCGACLEIAAAAKAESFSSLLFTGVFS